MQLDSRLQLLIAVGVTFVAIRIYFHFYDHLAACCAKTSDEDSGNLSKDEKIFLKKVIAENDASTVEIGQCDVQSVPPPKVSRSLWLDAWRKRSHRQSDSMKLVLSMILPQTSDVENTTLEPLSPVSDGDKELLVVPANMTVGLCHHQLSTGHFIWSPPKATPFGDQNSEDRRYLHQEFSPHTSRATSPYASRATSSVTSPYGSRATSPYASRATSPYASRATSKVTSASSSAKEERNGPSGNNRFEGIWIDNEEPSEATTMPLNGVSLSLGGPHRGYGHLGFEQKDQPERKKSPKRPSDLKQKTVKQHRFKSSGTLSPYFHRSQGHSYDQCSSPRCSCGRSMTNRVSPPREIYFDSESRDFDNALFLQSPRN